MKPVLIILCLITVNTVAIAQRMPVLSGTVVDEKRDSIGAGNVYLLSMKDSSVVSYTPLVNGRFTFDPIVSGDYILRVASMGYSDALRKLLLTDNVNLEISMRSDVTVLNAVTVSGAKKVFSFKNGDVKINIAGSVFASLPNTVDMLAKMPMVQVSPDGEAISVIGKGNALIYIDHQKATVNDLNTLSASDIKDVEIIKNPSAKYEAEGRAVILITRKKEKTEGTHVELLETASFKRRFSNYSGVNLSVKKKKWELTTALKYNYRQIWESNAYDFSIDDQHIQTDYSLVSITRRPEYAMNAGLYYQINENDYLSLNLNTRMQDNSFPIYTNSNLKTPAESTHVFTTNKSTYPKKHHTANLNYGKKLKKINADLFMGGQYSAYGEHFVTDVFNNYNNTYDVYSEHRDQKYDVNVYGGRADLTKVFRSGAKLEMGANISTADAHATLDIREVMPVERTFSSYKYRETNAATYIQLSGKIKKISYQMGPRVEYTRARGVYTNSSAPAVAKQYAQFFPKATIGIPLGKGKNLTLNYARSISRPNYASLSQAANYINPYFIWASNINIDPTIANDISANFQWKNNTVNLTYYKRSNPIYAYFKYDPEQVVLTRTDVNYRAESGAILDVTLPLEYGKWTATNEASFTFNKISDAAAVMGKNSPYVYVYSNNQFKLPEDFVFALSGWWLSKRHEGAFERNELMQVDSSLTKVFAKKLTCTLSWNDIFGTLNAEEMLTLNNIRSSGIFIDNGREFSMTVGYAFGTKRETKYKNRNVDENVNRL